MRKKSLLQFFNGFVAFAAFFCVFTQTAPCAEPGHYEGERWQFIDFKKVQAAAAEITQAKFPDCDQAIVDKKMVRAFKPDGTADCQDESYVKVLTEKGKRNSRTLSLNFQLPYNTVQVFMLEVIQANGDVKPVDIAANSKEMIDESQMGMNIYDPNSKILQVNLPELEIGELVHSVVRTTIQRSIIPGEYSETTLSEGSEFIEHADYDIYVPAERPLKHAVVRDEIPGTVQHSEKPAGTNETLYHWEANRVPQMFDEPGMPPYEMVLQRLSLSTIADWQAVSKWYWQLSQSHLETTTAEMQKTVADKIAKAKTDDEKVEALFHYVSRDIRYMGITTETDRPGFEPHDVKITYDNKYGVCRDKAALLVSLLRLAGLKAFPVLVNVGTKMDPDVPDPGFNHAIVAVDRGDRDYQLMDPTAENTRQILPSYDCDQSYLVCRPEGETLLTSKIFPPEDNLMKIKTEAVLTAGGTIEAKATLLFEGINDNEFREAFSKMKADDLRRFFESNLKPALPGVMLKSLKITPEDMADVSKNLRAELEFSVPGMTASGGGAAVVNLPWIGQRFGIVGFILGGTSLEKRKYPLRTEIACGLTEQVILKLDRGLGKPLSLPVCAPVNDATLVYDRQISFTNRSIVAASELKLKKVEFSPTEYLKLKETLKAMDYDGRKSPVFATSGKPEKNRKMAEDTGKATPVESNAEILESRKTIELIDAHSSIYRVRYVKRVLNYAGKKNEAEVKLDYNPACQQARIVSATVTSKTGEKKSIEPQEINVMDARWNASARRYTGGKTLVANLPGVEIGSTIEVEMEIISTNKPYISAFEQFQLFDQLTRKSVQLTVPATLQFQKLVTGPKGMIKEKVNTTNGIRTFHWEAEKIAPLPGESERPPEWSFASGVEYFAGDAKNYYQELNHQLLDHAHKNTRAAGLARKLIAGATNQLDQVRAIRDFVAKSIRRAGPAFADLPLSELSDADVTLADGYGHAADEAILIYSMLQAAGFSPEFVLASSLPPIAAITNTALTFPLPQYFSTPLVRLTIGGEKYYLNDSDQYAKLGATAYDGKLAMVLNQLSCEIIHASEKFKTKYETDYTLTFANDGGAKIGITRRYYGTMYGAQNRYFSELPPEERERYFQGQVSQVAQGARPVGRLTTQFDTYPGIERFTVEVDNYGVADGNYFYFDLPFSPSLIPTGADRRELPLFVSWNSDLTVRSIVNLPPDFQRVVIAPKAEKLKVPANGGSADITLTKNAAQFVMTDRLKVTPAIISPKQYSELLGLEATLGRKSSRIFLLEKN